MSRGKRYDSEPKLNIKKVVAVIIAFLVIIMFIVGIKELLKAGKGNIKEKTFPIGYYTIYENEKWGVIDTKGNVLIKPEYDEMIVVPDYTKPVFVCTLNVDYEKNTYSTKAIGSNGKQLFTNYDKVEVLYNKDKSNNLWYESNILKVQKNDKYGLINLEGKELLECEYEDIKPIMGTKSVYITVKDGKQGLVDNLGNIIIENNYVAITSLTNKYDNGFIVKSEDSKYGVIKYDKTVALETKYDEIKNVYGNNCYVVKEADTLKIVDTEGKSYLEGKFDDVKQINANNVVIKKENKYGVMTLDGETKIEPKYDNLTFAFTDTYIAAKEGKYGIISIDNEEKLEFKYENIEYSEEADFIIASLNNSKSDILDRNFNIKCTGIISTINTDKNYIRVRTEEDYKYYNFKLEEKESKEILSGNTLFLSKQDGKFGYVNEKGIVVVDYIYDDATEQNKYGYVSVKKDGKWGALDKNGKVVVEPTYTMENNLVIDFIGQYYLAEDINANYYTK